MAREGTSITVKADAPGVPGHPRAALLIDGFELASKDADVGAEQAGLALLVRPLLSRLNIDVPAEKCFVVVPYTRPDEAKVRTRPALLGHS
jgi:hypothetical protein